MVAPGRSESSGVRRLIVNPATSGAGCGSLARPLLGTLRCVFAPRAPQPEAAPGSPSNGRGDGDRVVRSTTKEVRTPDRRTRKGDGPADPSRREASARGDQGNH